MTKEQLRNLLAPVALYPDVVLASLLPATTFRAQVADAAAWLQGQGGQADQPPADRNWDGSVTALLQFPELLDWLDLNYAWVDQVATAVTYQQSAALEAIQAFRQEARAAGNLASNKYQQVTVLDAPQAAAGGGSAPQPVIKIQPAKAGVVYVPKYNPVEVVRPTEAQAAASPRLDFGTGIPVGGQGAWAMYSIFDDDSGDHISIYDTAIMNPPPGAYRPPSNQGPNRPRPWNPEQRQLAPDEKPGYVQPIPYPGTKMKPRPGYAGVRPPSLPAAKPSAPQ